VGIRLTVYNNIGISESEKLSINQESVYRKEIEIELSNLQNQVEQFLTISEDDFLNIGSKLRDYQNFSNRVNIQAKKIIESIGTEILDAGMDKLSKLFGVIGIHFAEASETIEKDRHDLQNIHDKLSYIEDNLSGFDKIVKTLRMLGIAAKIESARLNLSDGGFFLLAETVDKMSAQIGERKKVIKDKANGLLLHLAKSIGDLVNLAVEQDKQNKRFDESTVQSLETFKYKNLVCSTAIGEITVVGAKLTIYLGNIVQDIQFHDIARQQLQHVDEALEEMKEKAKEREENDVEDFSYIHDNLELQSRQLSGTLGNFTKSVLSIIGSLREVEAGVDELFEESRKIIGTDSSSGNSHQEMIKENLCFIKKGLEENIIIEKNLDKSIEEIVTIVNDLARQIEMIEEVGSEIELVALNAQVKAAHLGKEGASLGVLAEAIQKLSFEAKVQTEQTNEVLVTIDKLSGALRSELTASRLQTTSKLLETTINELNQLVSSIKMVEENSMDESKALDGIIKIFKDELKITVQNINIHIAAEQMLNPVILSFDQITKGLENQYNIESKREHHTRKNSSKYTMMSEREIHNSYTNTSTDLLRIAKTSNSDNGGLDDNIELF